MRARIVLLSCVVALGSSIAAMAQPAAYVPLPSAFDLELSRSAAIAEQAHAGSARVAAEIEELGRRRSDARGRVKARTRALYRLTRSGMLPVAGGIDALTSHLGRVSRLERALEADIAAEQELAVRLRALREEAERFSAQEAQSGAALAELDARRRSLAALPVAQIVASAPLSMPSEEPTYGVIRVHGAPTTRFASMRGALAMPVGGTVDVRDVRTDDGPGLELVAPSGSIVRAAFNGRVAFASAHGGATLVILDHEDDFFTVYAGLAATYVRVGDRVSRGARLGALSGSGGDASLIFQVRRGTRPEDARGWLGL